MKNLLKFAFSIALLAVLFCSFDVAAAPVTAADTSVTVSDSEVVIRGVVKDRQNRRRLSRVNVTLDGTNIGTVSNADGAFELRFSPADFRRVKFSHIGYATSYLYPAEAGDALTVWMNPAETVLSDVVVYGPIRVISWTKRSPRLTATIRRMEPCRRGSIGRPCRKDGVISAFRRPLWSFSKRLMRVVP